MMNKLYNFVKSNFQFQKIERESKSIYLKTLIKGSFLKTNNWICNFLNTDWKSELKYNLQFFAVVYSNKKTTQT